MSAEVTMEERATQTIRLLIMNQNENNPSGHRKGLWLNSQIAQQEAIRLGQFVRNTVEPITHEGKKTRTTCPIRAVNQQAWKPEKRRSNESFIYHPKSKS